MAGQYRYRDLHLYRMRSNIGTYYGSTVGSSFSMQDFDYKNNSNYC